MSFWKSRRVLVTGASGFVGSNLVPLLQGTGCSLSTPLRSEFDLLEQEQVRRLLAETRPQVVIHLAALSAGILANKSFPASFCYQNLMLGTMMLHEAWKAGVEKYVTLMGGCSYPATAPSPIAEEQLWAGYPQWESAPYSVAKKMVTVQSEAYRRQYGFNSIVLVPGNLYGPYDNFDRENSHVIPALIRKVYEAESHGEGRLSMWGTGRPTRDFIYVKDCCEAILEAAETYSDSEIINLSSGTQVSIRELVEMVCQLTGYHGEVHWDESKPDGQMYKGFAVDRMHRLLKYRCQHSLREGLQETITWFKANYHQARLKVAID